MKDLKAFRASCGAVIGVPDSAVRGLAQKIGAVKALGMLVLFMAAALAPLAVPTAASALSIGEGNNATGIAYEGYDHTLIFRWQTYGASGWDKEGVAGKYTTYSSPAIAETSSSTVIAYEGSDHSLIFRWQAYGSSTWNREVVAGSHSAYSAPSMAEGNNANGIAVEGPDHSLDFYWQTYGAVQWNEEVVAGPGSANSAPSVAEVGGNIVAIGQTTYHYNDIYVEGPDHSLVDWWQGASGGPWRQLGIAGNGTTYSAPAVVEINETSFLGTPAYDSMVAYEGPSNSLQYYWEAAGSGSGSETVAGPGTTFSGPSIATGNNSTSIAAEGSDHSLAFYWQTLDTSSWNQESVASSSSTFSNPSIAEGNNSTSIIAQGLDHSLDFYWQEYGGATGWNLETAAGNGTTYA
jgi:hypothetical protein